MIRKTAVAALGMLLVGSFATVATAESSPEALEWLDSMIGAYSKKSIEADFTMNMDATSMGMPGGGATGTGSMKIDGKNERQRMTMEFKIDVPEMGEMKMAVLQVHDGETIWSQMENPMMGGTMVMKMNKAQMEQMSRMQGGSSMTSGSMFGVDEFQKMRDAFDWTVDGKADGRVTISAAMTPEGMQAVSGSMSQEDLAKLGDLGRMVLVIDQKLGIPVEMRVGSFMKTTMSNVKLVDAFPEGTFDYTPPEGAQVMDMGAMMGGG